jgi:hypothetical protein
VSEIVSSHNRRCSCASADSEEAPVTAPLAGVVPNKVAARAFATASEGATGAE